MHRPLFIVNPQSAGGRTGRRWHAEILPRIVGACPPARWVLTRAPGQAAALAARARREGADLIVAVGGDGTVHEVVNGLMGELLGHDEAGLPETEGAAWPAALAGGGLPALGILPIGTGCDLAKTLAIPRDLDGALGVLAAGREVYADVCEVSCVANASGSLRRFSVNMCGCGLSGEVAAQVNTARWPRHGLLAFLIATLRGVAAYRPRAVTISIDRGAPRSTRLLALFVCNGQYCGGGMRPGLGARMDDGALKVVEIGAMPLARILVNLPRLYSGQLERVRGVLVHQARTVEVISSEASPVDCDGEQPGQLPATYTIRPAVLRLIASGGA